MILWNKFFHCCCKQSALFSGLLVIIQHHPVKLYHIALAFAVLSQQTHSVNPSSQQLCPHKRTFSHIAGISLLQFLLQSGLTLCQARFVHSLSGNAAEKFPPTGGMGDWGLPQQAAFVIQTLCLRQRRRRRRWLHTRQSVLFTKAGVQRPEKIRKDLNVFSNKVNITPT